MLRTVLPVVIPAEALVDRVEMAGVVVVFQPADALESGLVLLDAGSAVESEEAVAAGPSPDPVGDRLQERSFHVEVVEHEDAADRREIAGFERRVQPLIAGAVGSED